MLFDADSERSLFDTPFQRKGDLTELLSVRQDLSSWSREFGRSGLRMCHEEDERFVPQTRELFRRLSFIYVGCIRSHILSRRTQLRHLLLALPSHTDVFLTPYHEMSIRGSIDRWDRLHGDPPDPMSERKKGTISPGRGRASLHHNLLPKDAFLSDPQVVPHLSYLSVPILVP